MLPQLVQQVLLLLREMHQIVQGNSPAVNLLKFPKEKLLELQKVLELLGNKLIPGFNIWLTPKENMQ